MDRAVFALAEQLWLYLRLGQSLTHSDCIIGLGSYDLRVADRCADLYHEGWAPLIVFSGHLGNWTRQQWNRSESEIFSERAISRGVSAEHIVQESRSTNIGENIQLTRDLLCDKKIAVKRIIMVSKPSTERRMFATCQRLWPEMTVTFASPLIDFSEQLRGGIGEGLIHEMVGDIQRIKEYPARGFQIPQEIPRNVWQAYEELISLGFDKHLIG